MKRCMRKLWKIMWKSSQTGWQILKIPRWHRIWKKNVRWKTRSRWFQRKLFRKLIPMWNWILEKPISHLRKKKEWTILCAGEYTETAACILQKESWKIRFVIIISTSMQSVCVIRTYGSIMTSTELQNEILPYWLNSWKKHWWSEVKIRKSYQTGELSFLLGCGV